MKLTASSAVGWRRYARRREQLTSINQPKEENGVASCALRLKRGLARLFK
jgi:hypothetical protein